MKRKAVPEAWCKLLDRCVQATGDILQYAEWLYDMPEMTTRDANKMAHRVDMLESIAGDMFSNNEAYITECEKRKAREKLSQLAP